MQTRTAASFCRMCSGACGVTLTVDEADRIVQIRGDKEHPMTRGYACFKGLQAEEAHHGPARLRHPLKRAEDGSFHPIPLETALDEIAERLRAIVDRDGADAVGLFRGNSAVWDFSAFTMLRTFGAALGTSQQYSAFTLDQSNKAVSWERLGDWAAGTHSLDQSEVVMLFGTNPLVSHTAIGILTADPTRRLKRARNRGLKLIVVDPRRSETAGHADLFLQPYPGQDAAIAGGMLRIILEEGWHDEDFCARHVGADRMADLRAAVAPFTAADVEMRAGLEPGQLHASAALFARDCKTGPAIATTGVSMAPFSNATQHLVDCLNVVCNRFRRTGDPAGIYMLASGDAPRAQVVPPRRSWNAFPPSRIRGIGRLWGEKLSGTIAEEILTPGEGQMKALIVDGGNLVTAVPDQARIIAALQSLELLVSVDPFLTPNARLAHYVIPPKMQYERADLPFSTDRFMHSESWAQYAPAILATPPGSDIADGWYVYWGLARRLGLTMNYMDKGPLDMARLPTTDDLLEIALTGSRISLDELRQHPHGRVFDHGMVVQPGDGSDDRFDVMPDDVAEELRQFFVHSAPQGAGRQRRFLLSARRSRDLINSNGTHISAQLARVPTNPIMMNPVDAAALDLQDGAIVGIRSDGGAIHAEVKLDGSMKAGVVSMYHGRGGLPGDAGQGVGVSVNRLIDCARQSEEVNAMPWMSAIPVDIVRIGEADMAAA